MPEAMNTAASFGRPSFRLPLVLEAKTDISLKILLQEIRMIQCEFTKHLIKQVTYLFRLRFILHLLI